MAGPSFSVVMPLHNKARHVADAIASVFAQTVAPHELIVVDDASTDGGRAIVERVGDPRLRLLSRDTPGPGGYAARNLAIERASGDWIAFLDADDRWLPDHLEHVAAAIARHPAIGGAATRYDHVFADHRRASQVTASLRAAAGPIDFAGFLAIWLEGRECPIWTSAAAFRRDVLIAAGLFPAGRARRGGDKDLWLRAMRRTSFAYDARVSAEFSRDSENKVSKTTANDALPVIVPTARALMADANAIERRQLRRLINQEINYYARYQFKADRISTAALAQLCMPEGIGVWLRVMAMRATPARVRRAIYERRERSRGGRTAAGRQRLEHA